MIEWIAIVFSGVSLVFAVAAWRRAKRAEQRDIEAGERDKERLKRDKERLERERRVELERRQAVLAVDRPSSGACWIKNTGLADARNVEVWLAPHRRGFFRFARARHAGPKEGPFVLEPKARKRVKPGRPGGYDGPLAIWYAWRDDAGRHEESGPSMPDAEIASSA